MRKAPIIEGNMIKTRNNFIPISVFPNNVTSKKAPPFIGMIKICPIKESKKGLGGHEPAKPHRPERNK